MNIRRSDVYRILYDDTGGPKEGTSVLATHNRVRGIAAKAPNVV
jgi:hypothetical protein